jgi:hypothetical protein
VLLAGVLIALAATSDDGGSPQVGLTEPSREEQRQEEARLEREGERRSREEHERERNGEEPNVIVTTTSGPLVRAILYNTAFVKAGTFKVVAKASGKVIAKRTVSGLPSGGSEVLTFKCQAPGLVVEVNPDHKLAESNEFENSASAKCATGQEGADAPQ